VSRSHAKCPVTISTPTFQFLAPQVLQVTLTSGGFVSRLPLLSHLAWPSATAMFSLGSSCSSPCILKRATHYKDNEDFLSDSALTPAPSTCTAALSSNNPYLDYWSHGLCAVLLCLPELSESRDHVHMQPPCTPRCSVQSQARQRFLKL
jgi:hypothetical protein